jgi:hypothetical protein
MGERVHLFTTEAGVKHSAFRDDNGALRFVAEQDVGPSLECNKAMANHNDGYTQDRTMRRVAFIPDVVALKWLHEEGWWMYDPACAHKLARKLNDPSWQYLRTAPGRVQYRNGRFS